MRNKRAHPRDFSHESASEIIKSTVGATEIAPVETEVTRSKKQESRDFSRGKLNENQRRLAATYHFIIEETLKAMDLDLDEWYDVAAIGLCQAIADGIEDVQSVRESTINAVVGELVARDHSNDMYDSMEKADKIIM